MGGEPPLCRPDRAAGKVSQQALQNEKQLPSGPSWCSWVRIVALIVSRMEALSSGAPSTGSVPGREQEELKEKESQFRRALGMSCNRSCQAVFEDHFFTATSGFIS